MRSLQRMTSGTGTVRVVDIECAFIILLWVGSVNPYTCFSRVWREGGGGDESCLAVMYHLGTAAHLDYTDYSSGRLPQLPTAANCCAG